MLTRTTASSSFGLTNPNRTASPGDKQDDFTHHPIRRKSSSSDRAPPPNVNKQALRQPPSTTTHSSDLLRHLAKCFPPSDHIFGDGRQRPPISFRPSFKPGARPQEGPEPASVLRRVMKTVFVPFFPKPGFCLFFKKPRRASFFLPHLPGTPYNRAPFSISSRGSHPSVRRVRLRPGRAGTGICATSFFFFFFFPFPEGHDLVPSFVSFIPVAPSLRI